MIINKGNGSTCWLSLVFRVVPKYHKICRKCDFFKECASKKVILLTYIFSIKKHLPLYTGRCTYSYSANTFFHSLLLAKNSDARAFAPSRLWLAAQPHWTSLQAGTSVAWITSVNVVAMISRTSS